jgi:mRNA interferase MazF
VVINVSYVPQRGDLVWVTLDPTEGQEQASRRPALIISPIEFNKIIRMAMMCAIMSKAKGGGLEVTLPPGLKTSGVAMVHQVRCMAYRERGVEFIETAPASLLDEVLGKLSALIFEES